MMPALDGLAGIIILVIFGSAFLITCGISAVKAIRDRSRLKKRKTRRKSAKDTEKCSEWGKRESRTSVSQGSQRESKKYRSAKSSNVSETASSAVSKNTFENVDLSVYSIGEGVDNLTFRHSSSDIEVVEENGGSVFDVSLTENENIPPVSTPGSSNVKSHENISNEDKNSDRPPNDGFVIRKITRRHSYEVAICENSWMPLEIPCCSRTKLDTSNIDGNKEFKKTVDVSFENQAYDHEDFENT